MGAGSTGIFVQGDDVYVSGNDNELAVYWKNGVEISPLTSAFPATIGNAVTVHGSDVYLAGFINVISSANGSAAAYWKNGVETNLTAGTTRDAACAIAVNGNDVYTAGNVGNNAAYWKNKVVTQLSSNNSVAYAIAVVPK